MEFFDGIISIRNPSKIRRKCRHRSCSKRILILTLFVTDVWDRIVSSKNISVRKVSFFLLSSTSLVYFFNFPLYFQGFSLLVNRVCFMFFRVPALSEFLSLPLALHLSNPSFLHLFPQIISLAEDERTTALNSTISLAALWRCEKTALREDDTASISSSLSQNPWRRKRRRCSVTLFP